jgi:hypothetical protein
MFNRHTFASQLIFISYGLISWLGMIVHNWVELPRMSLLRPEYLIPTGIYIILLSGWYFQPVYRRLWTGLFILWAAIQLVVGAGLSVLPLSIWPFYPEQSLRHYSAHVFYGLTQVPLLWCRASEFRSAKSSNRTK